MDTNIGTNMNAVTGQDGVFELSQRQADTLSGFFVHLWCVNFEGVKADYGFYANRLDELEVPWWVQNKVSGLADVRENNFFYFRTILKKIGVIVSAN